MPGHSLLQTLQAVAAAWHHALQVCHWHRSVADSCDIIPARSWPCWRCYTPRVVCRTVESVPFCIFSGQRASLVCGGLLFLVCCFKEFYFLPRFCLTSTPSARHVYQRPQGSVRLACDVFARACPGLAPVLPPAPACNIPGVPSAMSIQPNRVRCFLPQSLSDND